MFTMYPDGMAITNRQYRYKYQVVGSVQIQIQIQKQILTPGGGVSTKSSPGRIPAAFLFQLAYRATMKGAVSDTKNTFNKNYV